MERATVPSFVPAQRAETVEDQIGQLARGLRGRDTQASPQEGRIHVILERRNLAIVLKMIAVQMVQPHDSNPWNLHSTVHKNNPSKRGTVLKATADPWP